MRLTLAPQGGIAFDEDEEVSAMLELLAVLRSTIPRPLRPLHPFLSPTQSSC